MQTKIVFQTAAVERGGKLRVAAYVRMNTQTDDHNDIDAQRGYYMKLIAEHDDWESAGVFIDICFSSSTKRPQLDELKRQCREGCVDLVIVSGFWRLYRDVDRVLDFMRELRGYGVNVAFLKERVNSACIDDGVIAALKELSAAADLKLQKP